MAAETGARPMSTSERLARYVRALEPGELPEASREAALRCVLDLLACAAAGHTQSGVAAARAVACSQHAGEGAAIWFTGQRASPAGAAFANSAAASILDLDDGFRLARGHPGAAVIPAALAVATEATTAPAFLAAIVAGYEVGVRVAQGRPAYAPSGVWSPHAAIAAAGFLRGTAPGALAQALSIAAQCAPALPAKAGLAGSDVKEGIPFGVLAGLDALFLAESGFTGPLALLDDPAHFSGERITDGLGGAPCIDRTYFKPYACCRHVHAPLDAFAALLARERIAARDIAAIEVHTYSGTFNLSNLVEPRTLVELQYSVPFCLGVCVVHGAGALLPVDDAVLGDAAVREIARKVSLHRDPEIEARFPAQSPARVVVTTAAGRFASPVVTPRGDPDDPLSWRELVAKFEAATGGTLGAARRQALLDAIDRLRAGELAPLRRALAAA
jgi:2-methylcitrate dehydratase PrpD